MLTVNTHAAKTRLSELLARVEHNRETIMICRNGTPVAELHPVNSTRNPLRTSARLRKVQFHEDPSLPLDASEWPAELR
jgi:prevent-host-death family protein